MNHSCTFYISSANIRKSGWYVSPDVCFSKMCSCYLKHFQDRGCSNRGEYIPIFVAAMCVVWLSGNRGVVMQ